MFKDLFRPVVYCVIIFTSIYADTKCQNEKFGGSTKFFHEGSGSCCMHFHQYKCELIDDWKERRHAIWKQKGKLEKICKKTDTKQECLSKLPKPNKCGEHCAYCKSTKVKCYEKRRKDFFKPHGCSDSDCNTTKVSC